jgi:fatty-acyl-CoA synthase
MDACHSGHDYLATLSHIVPDYAVQNPGDWRTAGLPKLKRSIIARDGGERGAMYSFDAILAHGAARRGDGAPFRNLSAAVAPGDVAQLLYTSGTTSLPKGAMVRHGPLLENNYHSASRTAMTPNDAYLLTVPSFSASGVAACCQCLTHGAKLVLMDRFSAEGFCHLVQRERVTTAFFADPIVYDLRNFPKLASFDLSSLRTGSGAPLSDVSVQYLVDDLGVRELTLIYGMSETSNVISRGRSADPREVRLRSNGPPQPDVEITIVDPETEAVLDPGEVGEIRISGYTVMPGYYNKPAETSATFDKAGRLKSGDLGMINAHGELVYVGRVKEMLKVGGFNIAPAEIEAFLETCPGVSRAAVVGVPDARLVEVPFAFIDISDRADADALRIHALCRAGMASYKVPRFIVFDGDWPLTGTQKVQKSKLLERAVTLIEAGSVKALA